MAIQKGTGRGATCLRLALAHKYHAHFHYNNCHGPVLARSLLGRQGMSYLTVRSIVQGTQNGKCDSCDTQALSPRLVWRMYRGRWRTSVHTYAESGRNRAALESERSGRAESGSYGYDAKVATILSRLVARYTRRREHIRSKCSLSRCRRALYMPTSGCLSGARSHSSLRSRSSCRR